MEDQNHACLFGAVQQRLVHHAGVFDAVTRVGPRVGSLGALNGGQHHVDFPVAIGVRGNLKPCLVHGFERLVQSVLRSRRRDAEVTRLVGVLFRQPAGAAAHRIAVEHLEGRHPQHVVAEAALQSDGLQGGKAALREHESHANRAARVAHGLVLAEGLRTAAGNSGAGDAALGILAVAPDVGFQIDFRRNPASLAAPAGAPQQSPRGFANDPVGSAVGVAVEGAARRVFGFPGDARGLQDVRIHHRDVAGRVADADGMFGRSFVEIVARRVAAQLGVLIARAPDHLSLGRLVGLGLEHRDQLIHVVDLLRSQPRSVVGRILVEHGRGMQVHVVEAGRDAHALQVDDLRRRRRQFADLGVASHGGEAAVGYRESLGVRLGRIDGDDRAVDVYGVRAPGGGCQQQE